MQPKETINVLTARYWEIRAEEVLALAREFHDPDAISTMLAIAQRYQLMARRIARREKATTQET